MVKPEEPLPPEVQAAFARGQPIEAIKLLISSRAGALAAAKAQAKEASRWSASGPKATPASASNSQGDDLSPGEVPRSNSAFWGWVIAALLAYLAFRLVRG